MRVLLLAAAVLFAGCGPSVDLTGSWRGTFVARMTDTTVQNGNLQLSVANGEISGNGLNTTVGQSFTVIGRVDWSGYVSVTYTYPGFHRIDATGTVQAVSKRMTGSLDMTDQSLGRIGTASLDLSR